jgi:hypothetical protein
MIRANRPPRGAIDGAPFKPDVDLSGVARRSHADS